MKLMSALVFSVVGLGLLKANAADLKPLTADDLKAKPSKVLPLTGADLAASDKARADKTALINQERCLQQLEKGNKDYTYKFVRSSKDQQYEIVEIPKEKKSDSYVRYYSANGYAEINSGSAACNSTSQKKDVKSKFLDIFKASDEAAVKLQQETDEAIKGITGTNKGGHVSGLATFRDVCARAFPAIKDYLQEKGQLPKNLKAPAPSDCLDPNSLTPCGPAASK